MFCRGGPSALTGQGQRQGQIPDFCLKPFRGFSWSSGFRTVPWEWKRPALSSPSSLSQSFWSPTLCFSPSGLWPCSASVPFHLLVPGQELSLLLVSLDEPRLAFRSQLSCHFFQKAMVFCRAVQGVNFLKNFYRLSGFTKHWRAKESKQCVVIVLLQRLFLAWGGNQHGIIGILFMYLSDITVEQIPWTRHHAKPITWIIRILQQPYIHLIIFLSNSI